MENNWRFNPVYNEHLLVEVFHSFITVKFHHSAVSYLHV